MAHEVKRHTKDNRVGCSCLAYRFMKGPVKTCKHIAAIGAATLPAKAVRQQAPRETVRVKVGGETFTVRRALSFGGDL